jgi:hypothetical protein
MADRPGFAFNASRFSADIQIKGTWLASRFEGSATVSGSEALSSTEYLCRQFLADGSVGQVAGVGTSDNGFARVPSGDETVRRAPFIGQAVRD